MKTKRESAFNIMKKLIVLVKPLTGVMLLGITLGTLGHLCAIFVPVMAAKTVTFISLAAAGGQN